tara:strand:+ start:210 stop:896 length:687 start_codon:yes stop_codon:yes gene_type:complete
MGNKAIILAAGESYDTEDIFPKILLKNPITKKTILENFTEHYGENCLFVLGFRSLSILNTYPDIKVVLNHSWSTTKSAHSLALAIEGLSSNEIVDIYSGDYFIDKDFFKVFQFNKSKNLIVASYRESRSSKACNLILKDKKILSKYSGSVRSIQHPESLGIIRTSVANIKKWIANSSTNYRSLYTTDIIPEESLHDFNILIEENQIYEINNSNDFLKYRSLKDEKNWI